MMPGGHAKNRQENQHRKAAVRIDVTLLLECINFYGMRK